MTRPPTPREQLGLFIVGYVAGDLLGRLLKRLERRRTPVQVDPGWTFYVGDREVATNELDEWRWQYGASNPQSN